MTLCGAGCRPCVQPSADLPSASLEHQTKRVPIAQAKAASPRWDRTANLRLSTVGLEIEQLVALRPSLDSPIFVRVEGSRVDIRRCEEYGPMSVSFEPEPPVPQRWLWTGLEFTANVRIDGRWSGEREVEVGFVPSGTYWLDRSKVAALRRAHCADATHFVAAFRVGRLAWVSGTNAGCVVEPSSLAAPSGCDLPWLLELVALDPHAPPGPACLAGTVWTGRYCRAQDGSPQDVEALCDANTGHSRECDRRWPKHSRWDAEHAGLPRNLDDAEVSGVLEPLSPSLRACVSDADEFELNLIVRGHTGRIIELELPGSTSSEQVKCLVDTLQTTRFATFASEQQLVRWAL